MRPIIVVNESMFEKLTKYKENVISLYGNTNIKNNRMSDIEIETNLTILFNYMSRDELELLIYDSKLLMVNVNKKLLEDPKLKLVNTKFLTKMKKVSSIYNDVVGINNEGLNKSVLTEVRKNTILDLKTRYSVLTESDILDLNNFIILKVGDDVLHLLKSNIIDDDVFSLLYGMYLNTNGIASNIDFNIKINNKILGSMLPYIKTMHSKAGDR